MTTNGIVLGKKLPALREAGLTHLNISLDTLVPAKFSFMTRRLGFERVLSSIDSAVDIFGGDAVKVNCVVMRGSNEDELCDFVEFTRDRSVDVRFIEYMPFDKNAWNDRKFMSYHDMLTVIRERFPELKRVEDADPHDTSKGYKVPGFKGRLGFITSMTEHFCGSCNRLRLTADGHLKACLFGSDEVSLRDALRGGVDMKPLQDAAEYEAYKPAVMPLVHATVRRKKFALGGHADMGSIAKGENRPMILIGG
jgi:cyclic pyranopterin phosphate synthase